MFIQWLVCGIYSLSKHCATQYSPREPGNPRLHSEEKIMIGVFLVLSVVGAAGLIVLAGKERLD